MYAENHLPTSQLLDVKVSIYLILVIILATNNLTYPIILGIYSRPNFLLLKLEYTLTYLLILSNYSGPNFPLLIIL